MSVPLTITIHEAKGIKKTALIGPLDAYVALQFGDEKFKTRVVEKSGPEPKWEQSFIFNADAKLHSDKSIQIKVWDENLISDDCVARIDIPFTTLYPSYPKSWVQLTNPTKFTETAGQLLISATSPHAQAPAPIPAAAAPSPTTTATMTPAVVYVVASPPPFDDVDAPPPFSEADTKTSAPALVDPTPAAPVPVPVDVKIPTPAPAPVVESIVEWQGAKQTVNWADDEPRVYFASKWTMPAGKTIKSLDIEIGWNDQGWGYQKGTLYVRLVNPSKTFPTQPGHTYHQLAAQGWSMVEEKQPLAAAPHEATAQTASVSFSRVLPGQSIEFWISNGGGGGHVLVIHFFTARLVLTSSDK